MHLGNLEINITNIIAIISAVCGWFAGKKATWDALVKIAQPLVIEAEQLALDGKIDKEDRKKLVLTLINLAETEGKIKLNFITRWMIKKVVNRIAEKLPDFITAQQTKELFKKLTQPEIVK